MGNILEQNHPLQYLHLFCLVNNEYVFEFTVCVMPRQEVYKNFISKHSQHILFLSQNNTHKMCKFTSYWYPKHIGRKTILTAATGELSSQLQGLAQVVCATHVTQGRVAALGDSQVAQLKCYVCQVLP